MSGLGGCNSKRRFEQNHVSWKEMLPGKSITPDDLLAAMWKDGASAKRISTHLNTLLHKGEKSTYNMIYDRARAIKLDPRVSPIRRAAA